MREILFFILLVCITIPVTIAAFCAQSVPAIYLSGLAGGVLLALLGAWLVPGEKE